MGKSKQYGLAVDRMKTADLWVRAHMIAERIPTSAYAGQHRLSRDRDCGELQRILRELHVRAGGTEQGRLFPVPATAPLRPERA